MPPPLVGGGLGGRRGLAPAGAHDSAPSLIASRQGSLARCRAQTPPPTPLPQGEGECLSLSLNFLAIYAAPRSPAGVAASPPAARRRRPSRPRRPPASSPSAAGSRNFWIQRAQCSSWPMATSAPMIAVII